MDSQRRDRGVLTSFRTLWRSCALEDVGTKRLDDYLADRLEEVTLASASKQLGILKAAYAKAIRWGRTTSNPVTGLRLNQEGEERIRWLTDDEEVKLLAALLDIDQRVVERGAAVADEAVDGAERFGGAEDVGGDDLIEKTLELAVGQLDAVQCLELFAEIALKRCTVTNVCTRLVLQAFSFSISSCSSWRSDVVMRLGPGISLLITAGHAIG